MQPRPFTLLVAAAVSLCLDSGGANAFSRAGCFQAPTGHRSIAMIVNQIDSSLSWHMPAETRACAYYARGLLYHLQGDLKRAVDDYSAAIRWMSDYGDAYAARGDAYEDLGQHDNAARDYGLAAQDSNDSAIELTERCWLRALRGRPLVRALQDCDASLKEEPDDFNALASRALVYLRMGNFASAIADCNAALTQKPRNGSALFILALAKLKSGDTAGGNAELAAANDAGDRVEETFAIYGVKP